MGIISLIARASTSLRTSMAAGPDPGSRLPGPEGCTGRRRARRSLLPRENQGGSDDLPKLQLQGLSAAAAWLSVLHQFNW